MFIVIGWMLTGMLLGFLFRKRELGWIQKTTILLIWLLLFLLGADVGGNPEIIDSLRDIGLEALLITLAAVLGSITAARMLWSAINGKRLK